VEPALAVVESPKRAGKRPLAPQVVAVSQRRRHQLVEALAKQIGKRRNQIRLKLPFWAMSCSNNKQVVGKPPLVELI
jgi:hypothetical protein